METHVLSYVYTAVLAGLAVYALHVSTLIVLYLWRRNQPAPTLPTYADAALPYVTVQIPLRNERYVVKRILQAVTAFDWPKDRLEIQILDDSNDDTTDIARAEVAALRARGYQAHLLHRPHPSGHKAGALAAGLNTARGEFLALFDADFCPPPDFLRRTVPHLLANPALGMVQARWTHLNAEYSAITRVQALLLDAHFTVEHIARNRSGLLLNFNGTAGVWRRRAIESAGGWQSDTIAEDLDLSYRAQLAGWKVLYLPDVTAPAELPPLVAAFKQQQYRWAKGSTQVLRKLSGPIVRSPRLNPAQKIMALFHMSGYFTQPLFLLLLLLTLPMILYTPQVSQLAALLGSMTMALPLLYLLGQMALYRDWPRRILVYPVVMLLGLGITWSTTLAVVDGWLHWGGEFVRTPKFHLQGKEGQWRKAIYRFTPDRTLPGDLLVGLYALLATGLALLLRQPDLILFSLIYLGGEILMVAATLRQAQSH